MTDSPEYFRCGSLKGLLSDPVGPRDGLHVGKEPGRDFVVARFVANCSSRPLRVDGSKQFGKLAFVLFRIGHHAPDLVVMSFASVTAIFTLLLGSSPFPRW